jgi:hypothetical protein
MVPGVLSPGLKRGRGVTLITHPHLVPRSRMNRSYTSSPPSAFVACSRTALDFLFLEDSVCRKCCSRGQTSPSSVFLMSATQECLHPSIYVLWRGMKGKCMRRNKLHPGDWYRHRTWTTVFRQQLNLTSLWGVFSGGWNTVRTAVVIMYSTVSQLTRPHHTSTKYSKRSNSEATNKKTLQREEISFFRCNKKINWRFMFRRIVSILWNLEVTIIKATEN